MFAFSAGLLIASAAFWFLPTLSFTPGAFLDLLRAPPAQSVPKTTEKQALPPPVTRQPSAGRPPAAQPSDDDARQEANKADAIAIALRELQDLPFEEPLEASFAERVLQADYAVMHTAWQLALPQKAMRLTAVENRRRNGETYLHQTIDILPGSTARPFISALDKSLAKWSANASLIVYGENRWGISVNGLATHELRLYPGQRDLPPPARGHMLPGWPDAPPVASRSRTVSSGPMLVIVIDDLGASRGAIDNLLSLDYPVTCAFWPHAANTRSGARAAHAAGREILVHLPMEPMNYPASNPGPGALFVNMDAGRIRAITESAIRAVPFASGLNNHMGSRFTQNAQGVRAVLDVLKEQSMFMLDSLTHSRSVFASEAQRMSLVWHRRNVFLDVEQPRPKVLEALRKAERIAQFSGMAIAIGHPLPETLSALKDWQRLRNKDVRIVRLRDLPQ